MLSFKPLLLFVFLLSCYPAGAQSKSFSCRILELIAKDGRAFHPSAIADDEERTEHVNPIDGTVTLVIAKRKDSSVRKNAGERLIILVDTFGFFTPQCGGSPGKLRINILNEPSGLTGRGGAPAIEYWVSGIATGRENTLAIAIYHPRTNEQFVYYLSVMGMEIRIKKIARGVF